MLAYGAKSLVLIIIADTILFITAMHIQQQTSVYVK